jgi:hypothetical protein
MKMSIFFSFRKSENRRAKCGTGPAWGRGRRWGKDVGGKCCVHMYEDGKMRPVETIPVMGGGRIKENDGGAEFNYDIFDIL